MCGIVGCISTKGDPDLKSQVDGMNVVQKHRGPDGEGLWSSRDGKVHFGHRRLSIIDLSEAASQPMVSKDGRFVLTYNGEIYNYLELKKICEVKGSAFKSVSDSEVIVEYIRHFGPEGIKDFRGMWAFALYDKFENTVLFSRDSIGIKPLHYGFKKGVFYFASEIKALLRVDPSFKEPDEITVRMFEDFSATDVGDWTFFKNIRRFPQSHYAVINLSESFEKLSMMRYWSPPVNTVNISEIDASIELRRLLRQSIQRHMRSDVPIAFSLSGGIDSSSVVALAQKEAGKGQALETFTTHFPHHAEIDETKYAKCVTDYFDTKANWIQPTVSHFKENFENVLYHHDEPIGSTNSHSYSAIFKAMHDRGIKVNLSGQGADELFAGYLSYHVQYLDLILKKKSYLQFFKEFSTLNMNHKVYVSRFWGGRLKSHLNNFVFRKNRQREQSSGEELDERLKIKNISGGCLRDYLVKALCEVSLPQILRTEDRISMMYSVESRVPFLDMDIINFVISLPDEFKIHNGYTKYILRKSMEGIVPSEILERRSKLGFPSPEKDWLKQAFDIDVSRAYTKIWKKFIVKKWREMIANA